jgi:hypothetical protein
MSMNLQNEFQNTVPKIERYVSVSTLYKTKYCIFIILYAEEGQSICIHTKFLNNRPS